MNKPTITLLEDRVLVKTLPKETMTAGGIIIPDEAAEDPVVKGKVVAVGDDEKLRIKLEDTVIYSRHAGRAVTLNGETFLIMRQMDILGIL
jgi:chaperonin GroES